MNLQVEQYEERVEALRDELQTRLIEKTNNDWYVEIYNHTGFDFNLRACCEGFHECTLCYYLLDPPPLIKDHHVDWLISGFRSWRMRKNV